MASDFVDKIRTIIKYYNTPYGVNDTSNSGQMTYTNNELPGMVQKNSTNEPIIDYPGISDTPSSLTRTKNGVKLSDAIQRNKDLYSGVIDTENDLVKPQNQPGFLENWRRTTERLGNRADLKNIDKKTQEIMKNIYLPTYYDALSDEAIENMKKDYETSPSLAVDAYSKNSKDWDDANYKYRVRAAQVLKNSSEEDRRKIYLMLDTAPEEGKKMLDDKIIEQEKKENQALADIASPFIKALRGVDESVANIVNKIFKTGDTSNTQDVSLTKDQINALKDVASPFIKMIRDIDNGVADAVNKLFKPKSDGGNADVVENSSDKESGDTIEYTYKPGDTFGQVISDLGLKTDKGLWGPDGDVEYYTKQLEEQLWKSGVWPQGERQNIPVGTTIKLKKRK